MRVGIVTPDLRAPGGVREKALFVARSLQRHLGASVQFVSLATSRSDSSSVLLHQPQTWRRPLVERYVTEEFTVDHVGAIGAEIELARYAGRRAILKLVDRCDVVHVVCGTPAFAQAVTGFAGPLIVHFASFVKHERHHTTQGENRALAYWRHLMTSVVGLIERAALRHADAIIAVNRTRLREARALAGDSTPAEVVHCGVDTDWFAPSGPYREDGYLLTVGRLNDPRKNLPLLLRAYAVARTRVTGLPKLVLAGAAAPDPESQVLISTLDLIGSVQYIGPQDRRSLADTYRGASAFVLSSDEEGQGIVIVEAMASGLPVIATSCVGPTEIMTDGVEGLLTPVGSVESLASAIASLCADPVRRREMSQAARSRAVGEFSLERAGARLAGVYRAVGITPEHVSRTEQPALLET